MVTPLHNGELLNVLYCFHPSNAGRTLWISICLHKRDILIRSTHNIYVSSTAFVPRTHHQLAFLGHTFKSTGSIAGMSCQTIVCEVHGATLCITLCSALMWSMYTYSRNRYSHFTISLNRFNWVSNVLARLHHCWVDGSQDCLMDSIQALRSSSAADILWTEIGSLHHDWTSQ